MKLHTYDRGRAERLVPLLRSILRELRERREAIRVLDQWLEREQADGPTRAQRIADLAGHRRGELEAERELEGLGCALDGDHPLRVLIPGGNGRLESGFAFDPQRGALDAPPRASVR